MSIQEDSLDFSLISDLFLAHGSLQSPSFLDGRLCAQIALTDLSPEAWLDEVCSALGVDEPSDRDAAAQLLEWRKRTEDRLSASELGYEPLIPDDIYSISEQAQGLKDWCLGFCEVLSEVESDVRDQWPFALKEALEDVNTLCGIETDLDNTAENENDLFALTEHARMAAMLLYTQQHPGQPDVEQVDENDPEVTRH
ncbi:UPF0149 family protein [Larsenimonas salina]|uniref:UPF0149 family protein n=1 Tax=Larsenimonas salina TaxID=1295565 RepID=UPI0020740F32|nr:YecA family protein [Larsenimonas salina]MCM5704637.1 YecA family protein [Larsenimonas salina]